MLVHLLQHFVFYCRNKTLLSIYLLSTLFKFQPLTLLLDEPCLKTVKSFSTHFQHSQLSVLAISAIKYKSFIMWQSNFLLKMHFLVFKYYLYTWHKAIHIYITICSRALQICKIIEAFHFLLSCSLLMSLPQALVLMTIQSTVI